MYKIIKLLSFRQLVNIHNDNDKCMQLFGKDLAASKQALRSEMFKRKPEQFR